MEPIIEDVSLTHAKEHLEELIERARRGEDVRIVDANHGDVRLVAERPVDVSAPGATDTTPPFVPLAEDRKPGQLKRRLGHLEGKMTVPARLMEPMTEEELKDWYGDEP